MTESPNRSVRSQASKGADPAEEPVLPDVTSDELDRGWGDEPARRDEDWYRSERPPHHE
jgi:hypothetical protein